LLFCTSVPNVFANVNGLEQAPLDSLMIDRLRERWSERERFVALDAGAGAIGRFLAVWNAWRVDAGRCERLHFIAIEPEALEANDVRALGVAGLGTQLADVWSPMTPNLHRLSFEGGHVQLLLALGEVSAVLPELVCSVDAFRLRSPDAIRVSAVAATADPGLHPGDEERRRTRILRGMSRLATVDALLHIDADSADWRDSLTAAGFETTPSDPSTTLARFAPTFIPRRAPSRSGATSNNERHALIIGAGLAGCASAWALAEQGWQTTLLDRHDTPAQ